MSQYRLYPPDSSYRAPGDTCDSPLACDEGIGKVTRKKGDQRQVPQDLENMGKHWLGSSLFIGMDDSCRGLAAGN